MNVPAAGSAGRRVTPSITVQGTLQPHSYDPTLDPFYRRARPLRRHGACLLVESGIGHTRRAPLKGLRFGTWAGLGHLDYFTVTKWALAVEQNSPWPV